MEAKVIAAEGVEGSLRVTVFASSTPETKDVFKDVSAEFGRKVAKKGMEVR